MITEKAGSNCPNSAMPSLPPHRHSGESRNDDTGGIHTLANLSSGRRGTAPAGDGGLGELDRIQPRVVRFVGFCGGGPYIPRYGPDLPSEAASLAGQFNTKRIGLSLDVLLMRPMKA